MPAERAGDAEDEVVPRLVREQMLTRSGDEARGVGDATSLQAAIVRRASRAVEST
jgi:hypothetical protein